jgi:hypothetical protein
MLMPARSWVDQIESWIQPRIGFVLRRQRYHPRPVSVYVWYLLNTGAGAINAASAVAATRRVGSLPPRTYPTYDPIDLVCEWLVIVYFHSVRPDRRTMTRERNFLRRAPEWFERGNLYINITRDMAGSFCRNSAHVHALVL